jgi:hypothetical protein
VVVGCVVVGANRFIEASRNSDASLVAFAPADQVPVDTPDFHFVMPATPLIEPMDETVAGIQIDESFAQGAFDGMVGGVARRSEGRVLSDEPFTEDGVWGRRTAIELNGGRIFVESLAKGMWIVSITAASPATTQPPTFEAVVASFAFT